MFGFRVCVMSLFILVDIVPVPRRRVIGLFGLGFCGFVSWLSGRACATLTKSFILYLLSVSCML